MTTFSFTCADAHTPIGFNVLAPDDDERCPLCLLRDQLLSNQPIELETRMKEYPFEEDTSQ